MELDYWALQTELLKGLQNGDNKPIGIYQRLKHGNTINREYFMSKIFHVIIFCAK